MSANTSVGKTVGTAVVTLVVAYLLLELAVLAIYRPQVSGAEEAAVAIAGADTLSNKAGREEAGLGFRQPTMVVHPYLGYVFLPKDRRSPENPGHPAIAVSEDGFLDKNDAVRKRSADRVVIGITGGSVAGQLGTWYNQHMYKAFGEVDKFAGKEIDIVWLGMPGYHQPQQINQLALILAQGGEFDYFINLDGFNELAVPAALNAPKGAHPLFPMNWSMVALDVPDTELRRSIGAVDFLNAERSERRAAFANSALRFSPTARLIREREDTKLAQRVAAYGAQVASYQPDEIPYFVTGPNRLHVPNDEMIPELVEIWKRSSLQMNAMCAAFDIKYLHMLQPNQYDPGSKPLSAEEKEAAFDPESPYKPVVEEGYDKMRVASAELVKAGVDFHDLSGIFADDTDTYYKDACCHFNDGGNEVMAKAIADAVAAAE